MLKPSYPTLEAIPENLKGAYVADPSGIYVLDKLDAEHPVVKKNTELVQENTGYRATNATLTREKAELEAKTLPDGHIAVPKAEFTQLKTENTTLKAESEGFKALGNLDEIKPKLEGYDALAAKTQQAIRDKALMAAGITDLDRARDFKNYDDLHIESEVKDGKEVFTRVSKDAEGKETRTPFDVEVLKGDAFKNNLGSLVSAGHKHFRQSASDPAPTNLAEAHMKRRYTGFSAKKE